VGSGERQVNLHIPRIAGMSALLASIVGWVLFFVLVPTTPWTELAYGFVATARKLGPVVAVVLCIPLVLLSVIIHELFHAAAAKLAGAEHIELIVSLDRIGHPISVRTPPLRRGGWERVFFYFAGPSANVMLLCIAILVMESLADIYALVHSELLMAVIRLICGETAAVNFGLALVNLLPTGYSDGQHLQKSLRDAIRTCRASQGIHKLK